jgi:hypothetical protein
MVRLQRFTGQYDEMAQINHCAPNKVALYYIRATKRVFHAKNRFFPRT